MKRTLATVFGVLMLSAASLGAQTPAGPGAGGPPAAPGEVRGTVIDADANIGIARASVAVRTKDGALITGRPRLEGESAHAVERAYREGVAPGPKPGRADDFKWPRS